MANIGTLSVKLVADLKKFVAGMKVAAKGAQTFASKVATSMRSATKAIAAFVLRSGRSLAAFATKWLKRATLAVSAFLVASVKLAANAEESENLMRESFEGMTAAAVEWSERLQRQLGLNAVELRRQAGFLNLMTQSMGFTNEAAFEMSTTLTELAADMASFRNESFQTMFEKIRSGITGMSRPLKVIGINLQEDAIQMLLVNERIDATAASLTNTEKVMARYILLLEQTRKDQGDLAKTYDSLTNVVRVFLEQIKLLSREIGQVLAPEVTEIAVRMRDWLIDNRQDIVAWFAEAKLTFMAFVNFLRGDFRQGFSGSLEILTIIANSLVKGIVSLFQTGFEHIGKSIPGWILDGFLLAVKSLNTLAETVAISLTNKLKQALRGIVAGPQFVDKLFGDPDDLELPEIPDLENALIFGEKLRKIMADTKAEIAAVVANTKRLNTELGLSDEELARIERNRAKRQAEFDRQQAKRQADINEKIAQTKADLKASAEASKELERTFQRTGQTIIDVMDNASDSIRGAFVGMLEDMAVEMDNFGGFIKSFFVNLGQAIARMQAQLVAARILGSKESGGLGIGDLISKGLGTLAGGLGEQPATQTKARGGIIKPVFAANGFAPKGSDTVPAMLTPGEGVLSKDLTAALREQLAVPGGVGGNSITFNVSAIDSQGTAEWLSNNKRQIAGFLGQTVSGNNPASRRQPRRLG